MNLNIEKTSPTRNTHMLHIHRCQREDIGIWLHVIKRNANPIYNSPHFTITLLQNSFISVSCATISL